VSGEPIRRSPFLSPALAFFVDQPFADIRQACYHMASIDGATR
jgi:hypothetical protein